MNGEYPAIGVHRVLVTTAPPPDADQDWRITLRVEVRHGRLTEWEPHEFVLVEVDRPTLRVSPKTLEQALPLLLSRLCGHAELWFHEERKRVEEEHARRRPPAS